MDPLEEAMALLKQRTREYAEARQQYKTAHDALIMAQDAQIDASEHVNDLRAVAFAKSELGLQE